MRLWTDDQVRGFLSRGWWQDTLTWPELFDRHARERPDDVAVVDPPDRPRFAWGDPRRATWAEINEEADRLAAVLQARGVMQGDVVGVQLPNMVELNVVYVAVTRLGAIVSPFPVQYRRHELVTLGSTARMRAFVTGAEMCRYDHGAMAAALLDDVPTLHTVVVLGPTVASGVEGVIDGSAAMAAMAAVAERGALHEYLDGLHIDAADAVSICWTSGTTGTPKGVPRAHGDWRAVFWTTIDAPGLDDSSVILNPFPMVNAGGVGGMFGPWLTLGCRLVQHQPFDLSILLAQIEQERVSYTVAPPAVLTQLLKNEDVLAEHDLSSLQVVGSGSAPLPPWMIAGWEERGTEVVNFFGSNEGLCLVGDPSTVPDPEDRARRFPRFGRDTFPWRVRTSEQTAVRIVELDSGQEVKEVGRPGELRLSGPTVFAGYLDSDGSEFDADGYFRSGDVFQYHGDDGEFLVFVDRAKDLVIRGGFNISTAEVESLLQSHPRLREVAAVGVPDEILGERLCAAIVPVDPDDPPTLADLSLHLDAQGVSRIKHPEHLLLMDELPRNPVGKVLRGALRDVACAGLPA